MPSADQVPVNSTHSTMRWHKWIVLIAGSTGSALRAVRPPNLHITPVPGAISFTAQVRRDSYIVHPWPSWPRPSAQSCWQARWRQPWSAANSAVSQGLCPVPWICLAGDGECSGDEQAAQIAVTLFTDATEPVPCLHWSAAWERSPIQAEKLRPDRKVLGSVTLETRAVASIGPTPGM